MKAFGMELRRDHSRRLETYTNASENCASTVWIAIYDGEWVCCANFEALSIAHGSGVTAEEAIANCEAAARRNHAALAELLERTKS